MGKGSSLWKTYPRGQSTGAGKVNQSPSLAMKTGPTSSTPESSLRTWRTRRNWPRFSMEDSTMPMPMSSLTLMMAPNAPTTLTTGTVRSSTTRAKTTRKWSVWLGRLSKLEKRWPPTTETTCRLRPSGLTISCWNTTQVEKSLKIRLKKTETSQKIGKLSDLILIPSHLFFDIKSYYSLIKYLLRKLIKESWEPSFWKFWMKKNVKRSEKYYLSFRLAFFRLAFFFYFEFKALRNRFINEIFFPFFIPIVFLVKYQSEFIFFQKEFIIQIIWFHFERRWWSEKWINCQPKYIFKHIGNNPFKNQRRKLKTRITIDLYEIGLEITVNNKIQSKYLEPKHIILWT